MSFRLKSSDGTVADGIRRVARSQIEAAIAEIDDTSIDRAKVVHQVRKRTKKVRGLLRLVEPRLRGYDAHNKRFRNAARQLASARDADVLVATYEALEGHFGPRFEASRFEPVRARLTAAQTEAHAADDSLAEALAAFRAEMEAALETVGDWKIAGNGGDAMRAGLEKCFKRGRKALKAAHRNPDAEAIHELRKRVKDTWYQLRLLRDIWPGPMKARTEELSALADLLGEEHDLAMFGARLDELEADGLDGEAIAALRGLAGERRRQLQDAGLALADRVYAGEPAAEAQRLADLWKAWRRAPDGPARAANGSAVNGAAADDPGPHAHTEIERKFEVRGEDWRQAVKRTLEIRQGYLCNTRNVSLRVRITDGKKAVMTAKSATPSLTRTEVEFSIPMDAAEALMLMVEGHVAHKNRHMVSLGKQAVAIDEYVGEDSGIVVAEIEMADTKAKPPKADWLGREVTGDARYYAANIAAGRR